MRKTRNDCVFGHLTIRSGPFPSSERKRQESAGGGEGEEQGWRWIPR